MKKEMVRRFTWPEILLHWGQGVLYLILFCTGAVLLAGRLSGRPILPGELLGSIHVITGVLLVVFLAQIFLLSVLAGSFRCLRHTVMECIQWRWNDVLWLLKAPLNAFAGRITLPPAGRFNAGQKLHVIVILLVLVGFSISGLVMILVPGALAAWMVHLACFLPATAFLGLHLFLALVNPETRKSLPSIFSGHITREYARQHHGLWIGDIDTEHSGSYVSLTAVLIVAGLLVAVLAMFGVWQRTIPGKRTLLATVAQRGTNAICPAPVATVHANGAFDGPGCAECHSFFAAPSVAKCLDCHDEIGARLAAQSGFHGKLTGPCRQCHPEHQGRQASLIRLDRAAFNHMNANFPLQGKHQVVPCEDCHRIKRAADETTPMRFIGLVHENCTSCHADPHRDGRAGECLRCHTMEGWSPNALKFDHDRDSKFRLDGAHAGLDCQRCHPQQTTAGQVSIRLFDIGNSCRDCHADPHGDARASECVRCHKPESWERRNVTFDHARDSRFPLEGKHASLDCRKCHVRHTVEGVERIQLFDIGRVCNDCHEDPHHGQFDRACNECHSEQGWKGRWLTPFHAPDSSFPLRGKHEKLACKQCHHAPEQARELAEAKFAGIGRDCQSCHTDPHQGQMRHACNICHRETGWTGADLLFSHDRHALFKLDELHSPLACAACHGGEYKRYRPLPYECGNCHRIQQSGMQGISRTIRAPADPHSGRLACADCHDTNHPRQSMDSYARRCADCHNDEYGQLAYEWARTLQRRQSVVEQLMESRDETVSEQVRADVSEAEQCGFHNLNLTRQLYDRIVETMRSAGSETTALREENGGRTGGLPDAVPEPQDH